MRRVFVLPLVLVQSAFLLTCGLVNRFSDQKSRKQEAEANACFMVLSKDAIASGESVTASLITGFDWTGVSRVDVDGKSLTSTASQAITLTPTVSRSYAAVMVKQDGSSRACLLNVNVDGTNPLHCQVALSPAVLPAEGGSVTASLQVVGTSVVQKTSIDGQDLGSAAGGSIQVNVSQARGFVGKVEATGAISECVANVSLGAEPVASGQCKSVQTKEDQTELNKKTASFDAENQAAREKARQDILSENGLQPIPDAKVVDLGVSAPLGEANVCDLLKANGFAGRSCEVKDFTYSVRSARVQIDNDIYFVYGYNPTFYSVEILQDKDKKIVPFYLKPNFVIGLTVDFPFCQCRYRDEDRSKGSVSPMPDIVTDASEVEVGPVSIVWVRAGSINDEAARRLPRLQEKTYDKKYATYKFIEIQAPAGTVAPECPVSERAT